MTVNHLLPLTFCTLSFEREGETVPSVLLYHPLFLREEEGFHEVYKWEHSAIVRSSASERPGERTYFNFFTR
jgi:hypothetical protein